MNLTSMGKLEIMVDGVVEKTVDVLKNGRGLRAQGIPYGQQFANVKDIRRVAEYWAENKYKGKIETHYHPHK